MNLGGQWCTYKVLGSRKLAYILYPFLSQAFIAQHKIFCWKNCSLLIELEPILRDLSKFIRLWKRIPNSHEQLQTKSHNNIAYALMHTSVFLMVFEVNVFLIYFWKMNVDIVCNAKLLESQLTAIMNCKNKPNHLYKTSFALSYL